jgi:hypothetical protein
MSQGDKRLVVSLRERETSADTMKLQALAAAEKAGLLRAMYNDTLGDWWSAGGLQTQVVSSSPSLVGDVYGGLMVKPDNAAYYLIQPGALGVLEPSGLGVDDNPYRVIVDPGVTGAGVLPFTSNAAGLSPRWDVVECQPADRVLLQETRDILNPLTGVAVPTLVDKVRAGQLNYRVRVGTPGSGFPGLAAGWLPLSVVCAPAGSSSLLTSDVWDVRPLVRERTRPSPSDGFNGYAPNYMAEYRMRTAAAATFNQWVGASEASWNGYVAGGKLERSTPSTLAQFGSTAATGGRAGVFNLDLADNQGGSFSLGANVRLNLFALFPAGLPRWQRYSQVPIGSGRVPSGPRGILVVDRSDVNASGSVSSVLLPTAMSWGGTNFADGCLLASLTCDGSSVPQGVMASDAEHWQNGGPTVTGTVVAGGFTFDAAANVAWPVNARRLLMYFSLVVDNTAGSAVARVFGSTGSTTEQPVQFAALRTPCLVSGTAKIEFQAWVPCLARTLPPVSSLPATQRVTLAVSGDAGALAGMVSGIMRCLAWSSSDR